MSTSRLVQGAIKVPKRIERGPTDILKALASTVKYLPKEPEPMLLDDPYLLPVRPGARRLYLLSRLSGIRTAKFLLNKHPELFYRDDAEPKIEAFLPREEFSPEMNFDEDDLVWCIENKDPENAIIAYNSLLEKDIKLENETLLRFFEMLCYTNGESVLDHLDNEVLKYAADSERIKANELTGLVSKIFNEIKSDLDPSRVYSAMIAGLARHNELKQARQVFDDFKQSHPELGLYVQAYDGLIRAIPRLESSTEASRKALADIIQHMEQNQVKPDLKIFNSILFCYKSFNVDESTCQEAVELLNDMYDLDIEPSLATYSTIMSIFTRIKNNKVYYDLVKDMFTAVLSSKLEIREHNDLSFFGNAKHLNNISLAKIMYKIFLKNPNLFPSNLARNRFLANQFRLITTVGKVEDAIEFYTAYVPSYFVPDIESVENFLELLDLHEGHEDIKLRVASDLASAKENKTRISS